MGIVFAVDLMTLMDNALLFWGSPAVTVSFSESSCFGSADASNFCWLAKVEDFFGGKFQGKFISLMALSIM